MTVRVLPDGTLRLFQCWSRVCGKCDGCYMKRQFPASVKEDQK